VAVTYKLKRCCVWPAAGRVRVHGVLPEILRESLSRTINSVPQGTVCGAFVAN